MRTSILAAAAALVLVVAPSARADDPPRGYVVPHIVPYEGGEIPPAAHLETAPDMTYVGTGIAIAGAAYGFSLIYALSTCGAQMDCRSGSAALYAPVVGPFITAAQAPTTGGAALSVFDGAVQSVGAALIVAGIIAPKRFVVWQDRKASVTVAPTLVGAGASGGLAVLAHM
jgi:hypothetical protein